MIKKLSKRLLSALIALCLISATLPLSLAADEQATIIYTAEQLYDALNQNKDASYRLGNDIDLSEYNGGVWKPIGTEDEPFTGTLDGDGFTIQNMCLNKGSGSKAATTWVGLFGCTQNAQIMNINIEIEECKAQGASYVELGGVSGQDTGSTISNVVVYGNTLEADPGTSSWNYHGGHVGGIVGKASNGTIIRNAHNHCDLLIASNLYDVYAGGISGEKGQVTLSSNSGYIHVYGDGDGRVGGIIGDGGEVSESYNTGDILLECGSSYSYQRAGGIVGFSATGSIINCYNSGNITSEIRSGYTNHSQAGGIQTYSDDEKIVSCYNVGTIVTVK